MPIVHDDDDFEDDRSDPEGPDPHEMDDEYDTDPRTDTIDCPYCGKEIAEDSPWCPHCGDYISKEDTHSRRKPVWIVVVIVLIVMILLSWVAFRF